MNLAYKKILGKFTKVLGFGKTPPSCWENFPNNVVFFFWKRTLRRFIEVYAVFVPNLCGEKSAWRKSVWRKNDKYEVCALGMICDQGKTYSSSRDLWSRPIPVLPRYLVVLLKLQILRQIANLVLIVLHMINLIVWNQEIWQNIGPLVSVICFCFTWKWKAK